MRKSRKGGKGKRKVSRTSRRLQPGFMTPQNIFAAGSMAAGAYDYYKRGSARTRPTGANLRGTKRRKSTRTATIAPNRVAYGANPGQGPVPGVRRGKVQKVSYNAHRKTMLDSLVYGMNPILKADTKSVATQLDWASGTQGFIEYGVGKTPSQIETMYSKMSDALYYNPTIAAPSAGSDVNTQRMNVFPAHTIVRMKNTCTHTCYLEIRIYKPKGYHTESLNTSWLNQLSSDNLVQNHLAAPYPTEENQNSLFKRPDFRSPFLNCRYSEVGSCRWKCVLEPGQETRYQFDAPAFQFDQAKYNVSVGGTDPTICPQSYRMCFFAHAEMVTDAADNDVCPGSGHIALNIQQIDRWQALPLVKKYQNIASYGWGTVAVGDEQDINAAPPAATTYVETA